MNSLSFVSFCSSNNYSSQQPFDAMLFVMLLARSLSWSTRRIATSTESFLSQTLLFPKALRRLRYCSSATTSPSSRANGNHKKMKNATKMVASSPRRPVLPPQKLSGRISNGRSVTGSASSPSVTTTTRADGVSMANSIFTLFITKTSYQAAASLLFVGARVVQYLSSSSSS